MSLKKNVFVTGALLTNLVLSACTKTEEKIIIEKQPPANMLESFSPSKDCQRVSCVTIQKSSLGKIFLLMASGITAGSTPQWYDLKPLVVSFEKSGNKLALLGENYNSIYEEIHTVNLIQSFDVLSEDESSITFDWGQGLKSFILQSSYDVDAPRGKQDLTDSSFASIPVTDSFVKDIRFDEKNIELVQLSKIRTDLVKTGADENTLNQEAREETLNMNIQIRAYNLSKGFQKKEYDSSRRVGFFVTKVGKKGYSNEMTNLITKWDISPEKGPILVRISEAVPEDYVGAVVEGALYWNKVFGREVITVQTGVPVNAGPQDRSIMIRWIPWLDSGAAYAIGQSDPLTGELLRAQVFMPSVFTRVGSAELVKLNNDIPVVAAGAVACDLTESLKAVNKLAREASDSQRLRLAQDSVRSTVAHELGHALGLRHNFAGSYSAKVSTSQIVEAAKTYLQDLQHKGLETSTSIMDYVTGIDDVLMSAYLKQDGLSYDKMAMNWAYSSGDQALDEKVSLYCTDDDIALAKSQGLEIYGCERFDAGNNPLLRKYLDVRNEREGLVSVLFASIVGRMFPGDQPGVVQNLDKVLADTRKWMKADFSPLEFVSKVVFDSTQNSVPAGSFASLSSAKSGGIIYARFGMDEAFNQERARSLKEAGGYAGLVSSLLRDQDGQINVNWLNKQVEALKKSPYLAKGKTLAGREYAFSQEEQKKILEFFAAAVKANEKTLFEGVSALLPKLNEETDGPGGKKVLVTSLLGANLLNDRDAEGLAELYLDLIELAKGSLQVRVGSVSQKSLQVPDYYLNSEEKAQFGKLLSSSGLRFGMDLRLALVRSSQKAGIQAMLQEIDPSLNIETESEPETLSARLLAADMLDAKAARWLNSEIETMLALHELR